MCMGRLEREAGAGERMLGWLGGGGMEASRDHKDKVYPLTPLPNFPFTFSISHEIRLLLHLSVEWWNTRTGSLIRDLS